MHDPTSADAWYNKSNAQSYAAGVRIGTTAIE